MLAPDGQRLDGEDVFTPARGDTVPAGRDQFAVRFHLHPAVKANRLADGHSAMLVLPNKEVWTFNAYEDRVDLEESVYLAGPDGPRRTAQIVIYGRARKVMRVQWTFLVHGGRHARRRPPRARRGAATAAVMVDGLCASCREAGSSITSGDGRGCAMTSKPARHDSMRSL